MTTAAGPSDLITAHAEAWSAGDVDTIAEAMGLPQMLAEAHGTTFIEDDGQLVVWIEARLAAWRERGVATVTAVVDRVEALPDDAARVTSHWRLIDASGVDLISFVAVDTLAADEGDWYFVVTDTAGEDAAWAGTN